MMRSIGGYAGKILHVDLTKRSYEMEELSEAEARAYIGGSGLAAKRLWEITGKGTDPLGTDNVLIFMTGPARMLREKRREGGSAENLPPFSEMLNEYYRYRGWDQNGIPTKAKLDEIGLARVAVQRSPID